MPSHTLLYGVHMCTGTLAFLFTYDINRKKKTKKIFTFHRIENKVFNEHVAIAAFFLSSLLFFFVQTDFFKKNLFMRIW